MNVVKPQILRPANGSRVGPTPTISGVGHPGSYLVLFYKGDPDTLFTGEVEVDYDGTWQVGITLRYQDDGKANVITARAFIGQNISEMSNESVFYP